MEFTQEQLDTVVKFARVYVTDGESTVAEAVGIVRAQLGRMGSPLAGPEWDDLWSAARVVLTNTGGTGPVA